MLSSRNMQFVDAYAKEGPERSKRATFSEVWPYRGASISTFDAVCTPEHRSDDEYESEGLSLGSGTPSRYGSSSSEEPDYEDTTSSDSFALPVTDEEMPQELIDTIERASGETLSLKGRRRGRVIHSDDEAESPAKRRALVPRRPRAPATREHTPAELIDDVLDTPEPVGGRRMGRVLLSDDDEQ